MIFFSSSRRRDPPRHIADRRGFRVVLGLSDELLEFFGFHSKIDTKFDSPKTDLKPCLLGTLQKEGTDGVGDPVRDEGDIATSIELQKLGNRELLAVDPEALLQIIREIAVFMDLPKIGHTRHGKPLPKGRRGGLHLKDNQRAIHRSFNIKLPDATTEKPRNSLLNDV